MSGERYTTVKPIKRKWGVAMLFLRAHVRTRNVLEIKRDIT